MNEADSYQSWLEKRRSLELSEGLSKKIVDQIQRGLQARSRQKPRRLIGRWLEWISLHPLAQSASIAAAAAAGVARLVLILQIVLSL